MSAYMSAAVINVSLMILVGLSVYVLDSAWPFLGLLFLTQVKGKDDAP